MTAWRNTHPSQQNARAAGPAGLEPRDADGNLPAM